MKIEYFEPADNPMFPPEITMMIRFVRPDEKIQCPVCGKKKKKLWTMLVPFRSAALRQLGITKGDELPALTPICEDHLMFPIFAELAEKVSGQPAEMESEVGGT